MNSHEWITFCSDFQTRFPSDFQYVDSKPRTLELWFTDVFSGLALADCLDVSQRLFRGAIPLWKPFDSERDRIPSVYQYHVGLMRQQRRKAAEVQGFKEHDRQARGGGLIDVLKQGDKHFGDGKSMSWCFRKCERMRINQGASLEERSAFVEEYFGEPTEAS